MASRGKKSEFRPGSLGTPEINRVAKIPHQNYATATPLTILKNRKRPWRRSGVRAQRILPTHPSPVLDVRIIFGYVSTVPCAALSWNNTRSRGPYTIAKADSLESMIILGREGLFTVLLPEKVRRFLGKRSEHSPGLCACSILNCDFSRNMLG